MSVRTLVQIITLFSSLSILSIGGGNAVLPEMHLKAVHNYHWLTDSQFADLFAISQAAPGPSVLIVTLIGYKAAGVIGAIVATIAMMVPAGILVYLVSFFWQRAEKSPLRHAVENGLAPLTVGLILASGYVMGRASDHGWPSYVVTALCTLVFVFTKVNPLIVVGVAGLIGYLGWM